MAVLAHKSSKVESKFTFFGLIYDSLAPTTELGVFRIQSEIESLGTQPSYQGSERHTGEDDVCVCVCVMRG